MWDAIAANSSLPCVVRAPCPAHNPFSFPSHLFVVILLILPVPPFIDIMPVIQRTAVRAASRSALRARQNVAALSTVARAAVNASSSVRAAAPKIAVAAVKPAVQGKLLTFSIDSASTATDGIATASSFHSIHLSISGQPGSAGKREQMGPSIIIVQL